MSDSFSFAMGEFTANFPVDRKYAKNHMWARLVRDSGDDSSTAADRSAAPRRYRLGLTEYAVRLLQDVYFLDWLIESGTTITTRQNIGSIESKKAESDLYSPVTGALTAINDEALDDPAVINASPYDDAWLIEIEVTGNDDDVLLSPEQYAEHLVDAWDVAQRTIKGQANH